ncbi:hypothetical protein HAX54_018239, partial [Datura stramonium]|nr:hypothetical protein [Datura stramonium]
CARHKFGGRTEAVGQISRNPWATIWHILLTQLYSHQLTRFIEESHGSIEKLWYAQGHDPQEEEFLLYVLKGSNGLIEKSDGQFRQASNRRWASAATVRHYKRGFNRCSIKPAALILLHSMIQETQAFT